MRATVTKRSRERPDAGTIHVPGALGYHHVMGSKGMIRRTPDARARVSNPEAAAAELAEHYARILGQRADRQVSDVIRACLRRIPSRLPIQGEDLRAVEALIERVIRLGEVGARDPTGSPRQIDDYIARQLGEPASGPRFVYRALRAMLGRTALVERHSRQIWTLRLSGLTDSSSEHHRALLAETPAPYSLPASDTGKTVEPEPTPQPSTPLDVDPSPRLQVELDQLREQVAAERLARIEADKQRAAADAELATLRRALDEERRARGESDQAAAQAAALERELGPLRRALDEERQARVEAERLVLAGAARCTELEQELDPLRHALDQERRACAEVKQRCQVVVSQLIELKEKEIATLRDHSAEIQSMKAEAVRCVRDARIADATHVWGLFEAGQAREGLAFISGRMQGLDDPPPQTEPQHAGRLETTSGARATRRAPKTHQPLTSPAPELVALETNQPVKPSKVGRNEPCPCGSGTKYKRCCGRFA